MSAMLGYLLDSNKDHGLGDTFVRVFLEKVHKEIFEKILSQDFIHSLVELEVGYQLAERNKFMDIQLTLLNEKRDVIHTIIIENKIKIGAANPKQFLDYYNAILQDDPKIENLMMIFLTPESNAAALRLEFENLKDLPKSHHKELLFWNSIENGGVVSLIRDVLFKEAQGQINPINEYMRHTLKAFILHASTIVDSRSIRTMRAGEDIGEIIEEAVIKLKDGTSYRVVRRDSTQIQIYNLETQDKEVARHILARFIDEQKLRIPHRELNTRSIGRQFFKWYLTENL